MYKIKFHKLGSSFMHYGRLGQKRGVRNYQNYDGSLTPLGREHYGVGPPRDNKSLPNSMADLKKWGNDIIKEKNRKKCY